MKILLISGHGGKPYDSGATGNGYKEAVLTRELVNLIAPKLRDYATVDIYDQSKNVYQDVKNGKFKIGKYDYVLEVHFNAYSDPTAHGSEIYVTTKENGITVEQSIMKGMKRYFTLRDNDSVFDGVKRTNFLVIKTIKEMGMSGALIEVCFITNKNDMIVYQSNKNAIASDIVGGIVTGFGLKKISKPKVETPKEIKKGSKVKIKKGAVWGGLSSSRGKACSTYALSGKWTVQNIKTHKGVKEALLSGINSWVAIDSLTLV